MSTRACRVAVLGSGNGTNFEALARAADEDGRWEIVVVGSDKPAAPLLDKARRRGIPTFCRPRGDYSDREAHDGALAAALAAYEPDLVVLAGYLRIIGPRLLQPWLGRMLNIHPSLLPKWPGLHTHERVLEAGDEFHGATVHFVTRELDGGPPVIQGRLKVRPTATPEALAARVRQLEHRIYPMAVDWYASNRLVMENGLAKLDGKPLSEPVGIEEAPCT